MRSRTLSVTTNGRRLGLVAAQVLAILFAARVASAQPVTEVIELVDGSTFQGELVEKVPGDHLTLKLATGETRRFDWSDVESARDETLAAPTLTTATPAGDALPDLLPPKTADLPRQGSESTAGPVLDWAEPDRTAPTLMASRLSLGLVSGVSPDGFGAVQAEYYPWDESHFTVGLHAAYGPWGALGPTVSEMLAIEWPMATWLQQGLGVGLTQSFRDRPTALTTAGLPDRIGFFDADCTHFSAYFSRSVMLRGTMGFSFPVGSGCGIGDACGRFHPPAGLDFTAALLWNFDVSPGDH